MGLEFIDRLLRTTAVVLLVFVPFGLYYLGVYPCIAVLSGCVWGMLNLLFWTMLIRAIVRPGGADVKRAIVVGVFKFPALYAAAYGLVLVPQFHVMFLLAGFSGLLALIVLKAAGMAMFGGNRSAMTARSHADSGREATC